MRVSASVGHDILSPPAAEGTTSTGIAGDQGPTRPWAYGGQEVAQLGPTL